MTMPRYLRRAKVEVFHMGNLLMSVDESLRIAFSVRTGAQSDGPSSEVKIYNLSRASGSPVMDKRDLVRVQAGYGDGRVLGIVGEMEIRNVIRERMGLDRITTMTLGASDTAKTESVWSQSYEGEVPLPVIVADIVDHMGLILAPMEPIPDVLVSDFSEAGKAYDVLRDLLGPWGIESYVDNGNMRFRVLPSPPVFPYGPVALPPSVPTPPVFPYGPVALPPSVPTPPVPTPRVSTPLAVLDEGGGLIGSPSATEKGARAKMLLNTDLQLDQVVDIQSEMLNGMFQISSIVHRGDTWSGEFVTEIEGDHFEPETAVTSTGPSPLSTPVSTPTPVAVPIPSPLPGGLN